SSSRKPFLSVALRLCNRGSSLAFSALSVVLTDAATTTSFLSSARCRAASAAHCSLTRRTRSRLLPPCLKLVAPFLLSRSSRHSASAR
ncbi:hypothetical protein PIB30_102797, partial [Stylosanthes scabra]|nr:hypothetical protein [Stylosanthes scabra]